MLLNNTNILNCGVAHEGRDRDEAALKQHASKPGEHILPKMTGNLTSLLRKKEGSRCSHRMQWSCPYEGGLPNFNTDVCLNTIHHYLPFILQRETLFS